MLNGQFQFAIGLYILTNNNMSYSIRIRFKDSIIFVALRETKDPDLRDGRNFNFKSIKYV